MGQEACPSQGYTLPGWGDSTSGIQMPIGAEAQVRDPLLKKDRKIHPGLLLFVDLELGIQAPSWELPWSQVWA